MSYRIATIDELQDIAYQEDTHMLPVRYQLGSPLGRTRGRGRQADRLRPEHEEDEGSEELYIVLRGRARFEIGGESVDAPEGTLVFVRPQTNRTAFAEEAGTTVLAVGSRVGQPPSKRRAELPRPPPPDLEASCNPRTIDNCRCEALTGRNADSIVTFGSPSSGARASVISRKRTQPRPAPRRAGVSRARRQVSCSQTM